MKNMLLLLTLCCALISWNEKSIAENSERISVVNESVWEIKAVYISQADKNDWQENLLKDELLSAGGGAVIARAVCGVYDVKVVDSDNHACIVRKLDLCSNNKIVTITDQSIANCLNN